MAAISIKLSDISLDDDLQPRAAINDEVVDEYASSMLQGESFPPVIIFDDGEKKWLADGYHRYYAAIKSCLKNIGAEIRTGTKIDALKVSLSANATHGLRRSQADKQRAVLVALDHFGDLSNRAIALMLKVDDKTVAKYRQEQNGLSSRGACPIRAATDCREAQPEEAHTEEEKDSEVIDYLSKDPAKIGELRKKYRAEYRNEQGKIIYEYVCSNIFRCSDCKAIFEVIAPFYIYCCPVCEADIYSAEKIEMDTPHSFLPYECEDCECNFDMLDIDEPPEAEVCPECGSTNLKERECMLGARQEKAGMC